jgi:fatty acid desaturase
MARQRMARWGAALAGRLAISAGIHFAWDRVAFAAGETGAMRPRHTAAAVSLMLVGMIVYGALVAIGADWSRRIFAPHRPAELWGWPLTFLRGRRPRRRSAAGERARV